MALFKPYFFIKILSLILFASISGCGDKDVDGKLEADKKVFAYFPFNGNANNQLGKAADGIVTPAVTLASDRFGNANSAYNFSPLTAGNIEVPSSFPPGSISIALWIEGTGNGASENFLVSNFSGTAGPGDRIFQLPFMGGSIGFNHRGDAMLLTQDSITSPLTAGTWSHVALVIDTENNITKLYVNGVEILSKANGDVDYQNTESKNIFIGADASLSQGFAGDLDDIWIFEEALTAADVLSLYNSEKP